MRRVCQSGYAAHTRGGVTVTTPGGGHDRALGWTPVRLVIAKCCVDYDGRLSAHLPLATRLLLVKADGSVLVHSDGGSYKPLNWMSPPCAMAELTPEDTRRPTASRPCGRCSTPSPRTACGS